MMNVDLSGAGYDCRLSASSQNQLAGGPLPPIPPMPLSAPPTGQGGMGAGQPGTATSIDQHMKAAQQHQQQQQSFYHEGILEALRTSLSQVNNISSTSHRGSQSSSGMKKPSVNISYKDYQVPLSHMR